MSFRFFLLMTCLIIPAFLFADSRADREQLIKVLRQDLVASSRIHSTSYTLSYIAREFSIPGDRDYPLQFTVMKGTASVQYSSCSLYLAVDLAETIGYKSEGTTATISPPRPVKSRVWKLPDGSVCENTMRMEDSSILAKTRIGGKELFMSNHYTEFLFPAITYELGIPDDDKTSRILDYNFPNLTIERATTSGLILASFDVPFKYRGLTVKLEYLIDYPTSNIVHSRYNVPEISPLFILQETVSEYGTANGIAFVKSHKYWRSPQRDYPRNLPAMEWTLTGSPDFNLGLKIPQFFRTANVEDRPATLNRRF